MRNNPEFKVLYAVIVSLAVLVMNLLTIHKRATQVSLHNDPMLSDDVFLSACGKNPENVSREMTETIPGAVRLSLGLQWIASNLEALVMLHAIPQGAVFSLAVLYRTVPGKPLTHQENL
jgi:hypothetical protein